VFPVTVTGCETGIRLPENSEISTFFYSAQAKDTNHPVHPFSTRETSEGGKGPRSWTWSTFIQWQRLQMRGASPPLSWLVLNHMYLTYTSTVWVYETVLLCERWGPQSNIFEKYCLLLCDVVWYVIELPMLRNNQLPPSSGQTHTPSRRCKTTVAWGKGRCLWVSRWDLVVQRDGETV
jgi:hypothetical protein